jgi:hypothetical protein
MVLTHQSIIQLIFLHLSSLYPAEPSNPHHLIIIIIIIIILQFLFPNLHFSHQTSPEPPSAKKGEETAMPHDVGVRGPSPSRRV